MIDSRACVPLFFITGFLGSGKTTLLNRLLDEATARGKTIGVIVNEWGQVNIDARLIKARDATIVELNNGQVFCSCLSGDFVQALVQFAERSLDLVIVETSGMANPQPLARLLLELNRLTGSHYAYQGMTVLVDPGNFLELSEVINAVEEQILASQRVVINKIDLAAPETVRLVREKIRRLNADAEIVETSHARLESFLDAPPLPFKEHPFAPRSAKTPSKRPGHFVLTTTQSVTPEQVTAFVQEILPDALRIKGFVHDAARGWFYVDGVNDTVAVRPVEASGVGSKLVLIPKAGASLEHKAAAAWKARCEAAFSLS